MAGEHFIFSPKKIAPPERLLQYQSRVHDNNNANNLKFC